MLQIIKNKKLKQLRAEEKQLEDKLIEFIGIDNNKYYDTYKEYHKVLDQIVKLTAR